MLLLSAYLRPRTFAATARIYAGAATSALADEVARIQSTPVLLQVISNLDLGTKWGEKYKEGPLAASFVEPLLRQNLFIQIGTANLMEIRVESDTQAEAASIARELAGIASATSPRDAKGNRTLQIVEAPSVVGALTRSRKARPFATLVSAMGISSIVASVLLLLFVTLPQKPNPAPAG